MLRKSFAVGIVGRVMLLLVGIDALAAVKNIRRASLPGDPSVQSAYDDVASMENMLQAWSPEWKYSTPKEQVMARVDVGLKGLEKAAERWPENEELQLLLGLVAHYSYNLDVQESYEVAVHSFEKAAKLAPQDYRPRWFLGNHECQSLAIKAGMERFLSVVRESQWDQLAPEFWDDYLTCAHSANIPAHTLRAADHANKLDPDHAGSRQFLVDASQKRFTASSPATSYDNKQVWRATKTGSEVRFASLMFGLEFSTPGNWKIDLSGAKDGATTAVIEVGPYRGKAGQVFPNFAIIARPAKTGESLADFLKAAAPHRVQIKTTAPPACPAQECSAAEGVLPGGYKAEGDALVTIVAFKRGEPEYPGLTFEQPMDLPKTEDGRVHYFLANERLRRLSGTLYYLVMLDTADSVKAPAQEAFLAFLKSVRAE